ncbi:hypothetical protein B0O99DRAFT_614961 [Bisporella sp. PMI_857]|nr:hypothetical protein B0O99DRAFT_614961 [Bisporella sp. PMI_857]
MPPYNAKWGNSWASHLSFRRYDLLADANSSPSSDSPVALSVLLSFTSLFIFLVIGIWIFKRWIQKPLPTERSPWDIFEDHAKAETFASWHTAHIKETSCSGSTVSQFVCAVCLDELHNEDKVRPLRCRHVFHLACLDEWVLRNHYTCPLCKAGLCDSPNTSVAVISRPAPTHSRTR